MSTTKVDTLLDAVNLCLAGVGRQPVPTLDTTDLDVAQASQAIEQVMLDMADNGGQGWWFNHEDNWVLQPDPYNGTILIPNNVLSLVEAQLANGHMVSRDLTIRSNKLYNKWQHTFDLRDLGTITCSFTMALPFEDIPVSARRYVAWRARALFAWDVEGDANKLQANQAIADTALQFLQNQHVTQMRYNYYQSPMMQEFHAGVTSSSWIDTQRGK